MNNPSCYRTLLQKEQLVFSAAHFITFAGDICERIHGHNYGVRAEVEGPLDENRYVVDFIAFRDSLAEIVKQLDHHVILPSKHPLIRVEPGDVEVLVRFREKTLDLSSGGLHDPSGCEYHRRGVGMVDRRRALESDASQSSGAIALVGNRSR